MSTPTLIVMLVLMALLVGAMIVAWKHMQVLNRYLALQPEMQRSVATLNAALLNAQATLSDYKGVIAPAGDIPAISDRREDRPTRAPRGSNRIAQMASAISSQQQARP